MLSAGAKKEALYLERFGRPLFPMDRMRREILNLEKQLPSAHLDSLQSVFANLKAPSPTRRLTFFAANYQTS